MHQRADDESCRRPRQPPLAASPSPRVRVIDIFAYGGRTYEPQLELRMRELHSMVDVFVVVEPDFSFNPARGARPITFDAGAAPFRAFRRQVRHHVLRASSLPTLSGRGETTAAIAHYNSVVFRNVGFQAAYRALLADGCAQTRLVNSTCEAQARRDLVLISDVDEIPKPPMLSLLLSDPHRHDRANGEPQP